MTSTAVIAPPAADTQRVGYIDGLRQLADILESNPYLPLPYHGTSSSELLWIADWEDDHKALAQAFTRAIPGTVRKAVRDAAFDLIGTVAGLHVQLIVDRNEVCERVVTGVETVTETVPDPAALALVPKVTVTRDVETVEWKCSPLLGSAQSPVVQA